MNATTRLTEWRSIVWPPELTEKIRKLETGLRSLGSLVVAYSGGTDSAFLAAAAHAVLGAKALAVISGSASLPRRELADACALAERIGIRLRHVETRELENPDYARNAPDRCFHCKSELFETLQRIAAEEGLKHVADGANTDDLGDYRPGRKAAEKRRVHSPLLEAGFSKAEIRQASRRLGLPTADKPASACLASRFPYGSAITREGLHRVEEAEEVLHDLGLAVVRVRAHGPVARIELAGTDLERAAREPLRSQILERLKAGGFRYVTLDLQGYRTGSLNEMLPPAARPAS